MSYGIAFSNASLDGFCRLDAELQEDVLDELDRLALAADLLPKRSLPLAQLYDLIRERAGIIHYVFLTLEYDPHRSVLQVQRLGYYGRASGA